MENSGISLCMICGNEAGIIIRCLSSAAIAFDELSLVRAIGSQTADETVALAHSWCMANGKSFQHCDYFNRIKNFPHVDDFSSARNLSFSLATQPWCLWLDCDDYLDDLNCRRIREAAKHLEYSAYYCTYKIDGDGPELERERLIQRGRGRWKNAIHETCDIEGESAHCPQIVVCHSDHKAKHINSARRNAAILESVLADMPRNYFYLQAELKMLGRKDESRAAARAALVLLEPAKVEERYLVLLNLSELEPANREAHLLEAARIQPHRREAFGYLCQAALLDGRLSDATSWFRVMDNLPKPSPLPWTHQGLWYGWARNYLRVKILRACGLKDQAEIEHTKYMADAAYAAGVAEPEASVSSGFDLNPKA